MTIDELDEEFMKMCDSNKVCDECKYSHPCRLSFGYNKGRADMVEEIKHQMISLHTDMIFQYGADIIEAKCDAFDGLKEWLKEQNNE